MPNAVKIAITNQKGGEGKTTTAVNLASGLARRNFKTLLVDLDPQGNTTGIYLNLGTNELTIAELFNKQAKLKNVIRDTKQKNLKLLPSKITLAEFEAGNTNIDAPYILRDCLASVNEFNYIIIDCPPSLSIFTINALVAADFVIVPLQAEKFSMDGIKGLQKTISSIKKRINPNLHILGALVTQIKPKTVLTKTILPVINKFFHVFDHSITDGVVVGESNLARSSIFDYNPNSKQAKEYESFTEEVLHELQKR
jgi:chromosome partitioning protein